MRRWVWVTVQRTVSGRRNAKTTSTTSKARVVSSVQRRTRHVCRLRLSTGVAVVAISFTVLCGLGCHPQCFANDFYGEWREPFQLVRGRPPGFKGVGGAGKQPAFDAAEEVDEHVVGADAACRVAGDAVEGLNDVDGLDDEPGFFLDLAADGLIEGFAQLDDAARERPLAFQRLLRAADEQDLLLRVGSVADDNGTDAGDRGVWVFTLHGDQRGASSSGH